MFRLPSHAAALIVIAGMLALAAACSRQQPTAGPASPAATSPVAASPAAGGKIVLVRLLEHKVEMPKSLPAGPTTFQIANGGKEEHSFEVEGAGFEKKLATRIQPARTQTLQADLKPGTYEVYCPVEGHKEKGMKISLVVK